VRCNAALSFNLGTIMAKLSKLLKVNEAITINRYDNGWMVEIGGRNKKEEWATTKTLCNTEDELLSLIKEYNGMELDQ
jgi:glycine cleavage system H lipoate-binding protein